MNKLTIFVDLDGLVCNLVLSVAQKLNINLPKKSIREWGDCEKLFPSKKEFFKAMNSEDFWVNIKPYPWYKDLLNVLSKYDENYRFLTSTTRDANCYSGKAKWIWGHNLGLKRLIIVHGDKSFCAGPNKVLIDDKPKNIEDFIAAGGHGFLWKEISEDYTEAAEEQIKKLDEFLFNLQNSDNEDLEYLDIDLNTFSKEELIKLIVFSKQKNLTIEQSFNVLLEEFVKQNESNKN